MHVKNFFTWIKNHNIYSLDFYKSHKKLKRFIAIFATSFISTALILAITLVIVANAFLNQIERPETVIDVGVIKQETEDKFEEVINIMFYGIDSRNMQEMSRSDAIMLVTIDQKNKKVKLTSIARDTRVYIEGYGKDKINHAFAYGWMATDNVAGGAELSIKAVNNAFDLNVRDYVTANFWALAHIIDFVGGVDVDVDEAELKDINVNYIPYLQRMGIKCELIEKAGKQHLTGGQAVAYCRVRHVGGTSARGERHQEVLMALFEQSKSLSATKYPELASLILKECSTSMSNSEIMSLGMWAVRNFGSLEFETLGIPTAEIDRSEIIDGVWYHTYDLDRATEIIHDFILEPEN